MSRNRHYDIVIVGGGLAGLGMAAGLVDLPLRVALVEAGSVTAEWPELGDGVHDYDPRVSAITAASQRWLEQVGAWPAIASSRICHYTDMQVWDAEGTGEVHFEAGEVNVDNLGHIVENRILLAALADQVHNATNVRVFENSPVGSLSYAGAVATLVLENGDRLEADLLVAADGANSRVRQWADFATREWSYKQQALVTTVKMSASHEYTAWQRFLPTGPLAFLPLAAGDAPDRYCSIVWSADTDYAAQLQALDDDAFKITLAEAFEGRLGAVEDVSRRFSFPLRQRHAINYVKPGVALVGDAAHSIHPLAGQGINLGFKDVAALQDEIRRALSREEAIGSLTVLQRYQRRRKGDNLAAMAAMDGFKRLFGETALPVRWLRNTGMKLVNQAAPLKRQLIRKAMGF
ncbi:2-octaprenylphenol hydroxylase [Litorivivens lipolytica]|uniref:2-octaprenylphenol hydroxylase n=1 Tax=Litorivivens lipolytica TaxID=1524264 RepID=A0A7W4Z7Y6_9GAMM|nr:UbiH/UbiF/VisC/COQ6 family ubiquinone biosynthesis hydroxylase [Litorivivens lipolytica]MBB3048391.1 2-octaprenylphenol hydroxylase [Litorivivens lipolytica]